ncbi:15818_t:CDS:2 [Cetraspora pellucida]|uniref:15818_t:CDS:1 n=1 Tax=Cetraspora pellucida TaxID=1433469 RepID=A0A9N8VY43_9GLOM|nr:15818_t:CDS:2 [Cetraspora pellucida]
MNNALNLIEVLENIISHIDKYDVKTQHSALLVNRKWCKITIQYLWSEPFSYRISERQLYKIIPIYMSFFSPDIIENLEKLHKLPVPTVKGSFNYPSYLRSFNLEFLGDALVEWVKTTGIGDQEEDSDSSESSEDESSDDNGIMYEGKSIESDSTEDKEQTSDNESSDEESSDDGSMFNYEIEEDSMELAEVEEYLLEQLCKLFISHSKKIKELSIGDLGIDGFFVDDMPKYNGATCLSHLVALELDGTTCSGKFIFGLSELCRNLSSIIIEDMDDESSFIDELEILIKNQQKLKRFQLVDITLDMSKVISCLKTQIDSLVEVSLRDVFIRDQESMKSLTYCSKLETLDLSFQEKKYYKSFIPLWYTNFPKLRNFEISMFYTWQDPAFIENTKAFLAINGKHLHGLTFGLTTNIYNAILQDIGRYCPKLTNLEINRIFDGVNNLIELLKTPLPLEKLIIEYNKTKLHRADDGILPPLQELVALKKLTHFEIGWIFSTENLSTLLENWDAPIVQFSYFCDEDIESHNSVLNRYIEIQKDKRNIKYHQVTTSSYQRNDVRASRVTLSIIT